MLFARSVARWARSIVADDRLILQLFLPLGWEIGFSPLALLTLLCLDADRVLFGWLPAQRGAARSGGCPGARIGRARIKMPVNWHFISRMHNTKQRVLRSRFRFIRTITLAIAFGPRRTSNRTKVCPAFMFEPSIQMVEYGRNKLAAASGR